MTGAPAVGGAASLGIRALLAGPPRRAVVVGAHAHAMHLQVHGGGVVTLLDHAAVRLPNAVLVGAGTLPVLRAAASRRHAAAVWVGDRTVRCSRTTVRVGRWWQPRPQLPVGRGAMLAARLPVYERAVRALPDPFGDDRFLRSAVGAFSRAVAAALPGRRGRCHEAVLRAADAVLGRGPGFTPTGDDVVAGTLAALTLLVPAITVGPAHAAGPVPRRGVGTSPPSLLPPPGQRVVDALAVRAPARTAAVSAALVVHAAKGEVAPEVACAFEALVADHDAAIAAPDGAVARLSALGHTSGVATAVGIGIGARVAARMAAGADAGAAA